MTTRGSMAAPVLDRLLTRSVEITVQLPATVVYTFDALYLGGGDGLDDGTWQRLSDTQLRIGLADAAGVDFPFPQDLNLPVAVAIAWDAAPGSDLNITALEVVRGGFTFVPLSLRLTFDAALPPAGTSLTIAVATGAPTETTQTVERKEWCALRDFTGRDQLTSPISACSS